MPTLFRFLVVVGILGALGYFGLFSLATMVDPRPREMSVPISPDKFFKPPR